MAISGFKQPVWDSDKVRSESGPPTSTITPLKTKPSSPVISRESTFVRDQTTRESYDANMSILTNPETEGIIHEEQEGIEKGLECLAPDDRKLVVNELNEIDKATLKPFETILAQTDTRPSDEKRNAIVDEFCKSLSSPLKAELETFLKTIPLDELTNAEIQGLKGGTSVSTGVVGDKIDGHYVNSMLSSLKKLIDTNKLTSSLLSEIKKLDTSTALPPKLAEDQRSLVRSVLQDIAFPHTISQHSRGTCAATTVQILMAVSDPEKYVKIVNGLAIDGKVGPPIVKEGEITRKDESLVNDKSSRSISARLIQPAFMEFASKEEYINSLDGHFKKGKTSDLKLLSENKKELETYIKSVSPSRTKEIMRLLTEGPNNINSSPVVNFKYLTENAIEKQSSIILDTLRPPLSESDKKDIMEGIVKYSRFVHDGLINTEINRLLEAFDFKGTSIEESKTPLVSRSDIFKQVKEHLAGAPTPPPKGPVPTSLEWSGGSHEILVTDMDSSDACFINPWGELNKMPIAEFEKRINGAFLTDRIDDRTYRSDKITPPDKYELLAESRYKSTKDLIITGLGDTPLANSLGNKFKDLEMDKDLLEKLLPVINANKGRPEICQVIINKLSEIDNKDVATNFCNIIIRSENLLKLPKFDFGKVLANMDFKDSSASNIKELNNFSTLCYYSSVLLNPPNKFIDETQAINVVTDLSSPISKIVSNCRDVMLNKSGLVPEIMAVDPIKAEIKSLITSGNVAKSEKYLGTIKNLNSAMEEANKLLKLKPAIIDKNALIDKVKLIIANYETESVKAPELADLYKNLSRSSEIGILTELEVKKILESPTDKLAIVFNTAIKSAISLWDSGEKLTNENFTKENLKKIITDILKAEDKEPAQKKELLDKLTTVYKDLSNIKEYVTVGLTDETTSIEILKNPISDTALTFLKQKAVWDNGDKLVTAGLLSSEELKKSISDIMSVKGKIPVTQQSELESLATKYETSLKKYEEIKEDVKKVWIPGHALVQGNILNEDEFKKEILKIVTSSGTPLTYSALNTALESLNVINAKKELVDLAIVYEPAYQALQNGEKIAMKTTVQAQISTILQSTATPAEKQTQLSNLSKALETSVKMFITINKELPFNMKGDFKNQIENILKSPATPAEKQIQLSDLSKAFQPIPDIVNNKELQAIVSPLYLKNLFSEILKSPAAPAEKQMQLSNLSKALSAILDIVNNKKDIPEPIYNSFKLQISQIMLSKINPDEKTAQLSDISKNFETAININKKFQSIIQPWIYLILNEKIDSKGKQIKLEALDKKMDLNAHEVIETAIKINTKFSDMQPSIIGILISPIEPKEKQIKLEALSSYSDLMNKTQLLTKMQTFNDLLGQDDTLTLISPEDIKKAVISVIETGIKTDKQVDTLLALDNKLKALAELYDQFNLLVTGDETNPSNFKTRVENILKMPNTPPSIDSKADLPIAVNLILGAIKSVTDTIK